MVTLISKNLNIVEKLASALDSSAGDLLDRDNKTIASEFLAQDRAVEQIELFIAEVNKSHDFNFKGKKLLEIGSGVGTFLITTRVNYGIESYGIEPSEDEFSPFHEISSVLLKEYDLPRDIVVKGQAEKLPFADSTFDLIYSTNVLEHVQDPKKVIEESVRVLKPGGFLQFVIPNYFSFWEGHYGIIWPCLTNKLLAKAYAKLVGKNPAYVDTLQLISPMVLTNILDKMNNKIEVIGWGKNIFKKRLETGNYSDWASLQNIRPIVSLIQKLKISSLVASILNLFNMQTPIVLTVRKC